MTKAAWREAIQSLVDAFPFYVMVIDRFHRIVAVNAATRALVPNGEALVGRTARRRSSATW